jgi:hypothetical protein
MRIAYRRGEPGKLRRGTRFGKEVWRVDTGGGIKYRARP